MARTFRLIGEMLAGGGRGGDGAEAPGGAKDLGTQCCEDEKALDAGHLEGKWCKAPEGKHERAKNNEAREKTVEGVREGGWSARAPAHGGERERERWRAVRLEHSMQR